MYPVSVKNLFIGKSSITFKVEPVVDNKMSILTYPSTLLPSNLVGDICSLNNKSNRTDPDYCIMNGNWDPKSHTYTISNRYYDNGYSVWFTGIPFEDNIEYFLLPDTVYTYVYVDNYRKYLIQVTKHKNESRRV